MRTELRALGGVHDSLEESSEDRRVHLAPVEGARLDQDGKLSPDQVKRRGLVEEVSVEVWYGLPVEIASLGHRLEKLGNVPIDEAWVPVGLLEKLAENLIRQEFDIFGEHAEDQAIQEVGNFRRIGKPLPHARGQLRQLLGGLLRDLLDGLLGPESFGLVEGAAEPFEIGGPGERVECEGWFNNARFRVTLGIPARTLIGPALERVYASHWLPCRGFSSARTACTPIKLEK